MKSYQLGHMNSLSVLPKDTTIELTRLCSTLSY